MPSSTHSKSDLILVTGGAGFIGSALVWALNRRGHDNILVSDRLHSDEKWRNLVGLRYRDYVDADRLLAMTAEQPTYFGTPAFVYHLGACSATTEKNSAYLMENNFEFTKKLALWALELKSRFAYASSAATYGDGEQGMDDKEEDLARLQPLNMYGYSKHLFDLFAQKHGILNSLVGLKYFNVFGPNENHKGDMRSVVNKAFAQIRDTGTLQLFKSHRPDYGDGEQKRDFLYVKDAVEMTIFLAENPAAGGLYNLGSGQANSWVTLAKAIFAAMDLPPKIDFIDMPEHLRAKYQYYTCADVSKLRSAGYQAEITPLADAVSDYVRNYLAPDRLLGM